MVQRIGGLRRKTRGKLRKSLRTKGKISIRRYFQEFKVDQKVGLSFEPAVQKGTYHPRFYGKAGIIKGKIGECYEVAIKDGKIKKSLIIHPVHLKEL